MRNFGLVPRSTRFDTAAPPLKSKIATRRSRIISGVGLIGLAVVVYALAVGFGIEREIVGLLSFMPLRNQPET